MAITLRRGKALSVFSLTMINVIAIDSLKNLSINAAMGWHLIIFYALVAVFFLLPSVLITAELATHYPEEGGVFAWVSQAFGPRIGFLNIWLQWVYNVIWYPTILSFITANFFYWIAPQAIGYPALMMACMMGFFTLSTVLNTLGMRLSGMLSILSALVGTLFPMLVLIILAGFWLITGHGSSAQPPVTGATMSQAMDWHHLMFIVSLFFSFMGLEMSAVHVKDVANPRRDYARALTYSAIIIFLTLLCASMAITLVVPRGQLNIITSLDDAFLAFLSAFGLQQYLPWILFSIILGAFGGMAAWVIGPAKALSVAAKAGCIAPVLGKTNRYEVPVVLLAIQWVLVLALTLGYVFFDSLQHWYWLLSDLSAEIALLFYVVLFLAAWKLRAGAAPHPEAFSIPGGRLGLTLVVLLGVCSCLVAMGVGFIPPMGMTHSMIFLYELVLVLGLALFCLLPFLLLRR